MKAKLGARTIAWEECGHGTPLVLLHAFPLDRRMWRKVADELALDARVITPDHAGLGESEGPATIDEAADDVAALLDRLGVARAVVGGLSMGGYVSLAVARRHPRRVAGLLLADTRAGADSAEGRSARDAAITQIAREGTRPYIESMLPRLLAGHDEKARDYASALMQLQPAMGVAGGLAALRDRPDATAGLSAIAVPTTVIVGDEDRLTPIDEARRLVDGIAGATLVVVPRAGHLSAMEQPARFAAATRALLARVGPLAG